MYDHRVVVRLLAVLVVRTADVEVAVVVSPHQLGRLFKSIVSRLLDTYLFEVCVCLDGAEVLPEYLVDPVAQQVDRVELVGGVLLLAVALTVGSCSCHGEVPRP